MVLNLQNPTHPVFNITLKLVLLNIYYHIISIVKVY